MAGPIVVAAGADYLIGSWTVDTITESLVFLPVSALFLLVGPRILLGWGTVTGRGGHRPAGVCGDGWESEIAVGEVLSRRGELDAFRILDELELRLGRGPFLTPIRLEAALLALQANGHLRARDDGRGRCTPWRSGDATVGRPAMPGRRAPRRLGSDQSRVLETGSPRGGRVGRRPEAWKREP